jgi:8-oxo-dGTP diphosphatase
MRAAGGIVWRRREGGRADELEVAVVHRPKYDDWSFPKGKQERGETDEETARREVQEETGLTCRLGVELPTVRYRLADRRRKVVRYWAMTVESQVDRAPDHEVDEWRWCPRSEADDLLTYDRDRVVLAALPSTPAS